MIVVPSSDESSIMSLAERIRTCISSRPIAADHGDVWVTASLGVAVCSESSAADVQVLLRVCDEALYSAKRKGRNRCEFAAPGQDANPMPVFADPASLESDGRNEGLRIFRPPVLPAAVERRRIRCLHLHAESGRCARLVASGA